MTAVSDETGRDAIGELIELVASGHFYEDYDASCALLGRARKAYATLSAAPVEPELISGAEMDAIEAAAIAGKPLTSTDRDLAERQLPQTFQDELKDLRQRAAPVAQEPVAALIEETGSRDVEDLRDMALVGHATMAAIESVTKCDGPFKDWSPAECPSEIIIDLVNALDDALASPPATPAGVGADEIRSACIEHASLNMTVEAAHQQADRITAAILALLSRE